MRATDPNEEDNQPPEKKLKTFSEEDKGIERLLDIAFACQSEVRDQWFQKQEKEMMSRILGVNVVALRVHANHRNTFHSSNQQLQECSRLSEMINEDQDIFIADHPPVKRGIKLNHRVSGQVLQSTMMIQKPLRRKQRFSI